MVQSLIHSCFARKPNWRSNVDSIKAKRNQTSMLSIKKIILLILTFICIQSFGQTWEQIGPAGGYFKEFTFHPTDPATIYAGSDDGGGVWKSTNSGQSWALMTADFPNMTGWSITLDPNNPNTVYACDVYSRYGLLKSTDGGNSWNQMVDGLSSQYDRMVSGITLKSTDTLFISTGEGSTTIPPRPGNGVFKSYAGGNSWSTAGLQGHTVLSIGSNVFGTLFAGTESNGLQFSNDNGANWLAHPQIVANAAIFEIEVKDSVIAVASSAGIFLSTNWGIDFVNTGLAGDFNFDVSIQSTFPAIELWSTTFAGLQKYSSTTASWTLISDPQLADKLVIGIGTSNSNVMVGTFSNGPIYLSDDSGINWNTTATSPICTEINDFIVDPNNPDHLFTCLLGTYNIGGNFNDQCIYETTNNGVTWQRKGPDAHALCLTANPLNFNTSYLGTFSQGLYKTSDGFNSSTQLISGNKWIADIAISTRDTNVVLVAEFDLDLNQFSIQRSTDGGNNFDLVSNIPTSRICFNPLNNDTLYAATPNGVVRSTDFGITWNPWLLSGHNVQALTYTVGVLYAGTDAGALFKIGGTNVTDISGGWQTPVQIKSIYKTGSNLFVGLNGSEQDTTQVLNGGIWTSTNEGASWVDITSDLVATNVYGNNVIALVNSDLIVATYGGGIFRAADFIVGIDEVDSDHFLQVYPNPTTDYLTVNAKDDITFYTLLDLNGKILQSKAINPPSTAVLKMNLSALSKGFYTLIIRLDNNQTLVKKLVKQ